MRVVFMGTPEFSVPSLRALLDAGHEVAGVFTQPDKPKGRGGKMAESPVKLLAKERGIPVFQPTRIRRDGIDDLRALAPDLCVTAAFGQILSEAVLSVPRLGTVNVHASLLPRHRGAAPVQWAILAGDAETGVTTMLTDKGIDTGDMLMRTVVPIGAREMAGELLARLSEAGARLLIDTLDAIARGDCPREKQDESRATYDPMLQKEMGLLDFGESAIALERRVRAMNPWPCAYTPLAEGVMKIWSATAIPADAAGTLPLADARFGAARVADAKGGLVLACGDGALRLDEIQLPGGKRMPASAFLRGHPICAGTAMNEVKL